MVHLQEKTSQKAPFLFAHHHLRQHLLIPVLTIQMAITPLVGVASVMQLLIRSKKIQAVPDRERQKKLLARAKAHTIIVLWRATNVDVVSGVI